MATHHVSKIPHVTVIGIIAMMSLCCHSCTKKVVGHRGIYSSQQLPEETETPILDAIGNAFGGDSDKRNKH